MPRSGELTRKRILDEAILIVSQESLADLSLDRICDKAGISRRAFYTHFPSRDHFLAALVEHHRPRYLDRYRRWSEECGPNAGIKQRIVRIFTEISNLSQKPEWKGCCFVRLSAELGTMRGHPVHAIVAQAFQDMENWFADELSVEGYSDPQAIARQLVVVINGTLLVSLVTRSSDYALNLAKLIDGIVPDVNSNKGARAV